MTVEKRVLISPSDIIAVELECRHCGAKHLVRFEKLIRMIYECANCREPLIRASADPKPKSEELLLIEFVKLLEEIKNRTLNAIVRFQITVDEA